MQLYRLVPPDQTAVDECSRHTYYHQSVALVHNSSVACRSVVAVLAVWKLSQIYLRATTLVVWWLAVLAVLCVSALLCP